MTAAAGTVVLTAMPVAPGAAAALDPVAVDTAGSCCRCGIGAKVPPCRATVTGSWEGAISAAAAAACVWWVSRWVSSSALSNDIMSTSDPG